MGATRGMILRIFLLSGASIGVVGTIAGFALGLAFADNIESIRQGLQSLRHTTLFPAEIYFLSQLPAIVDPRRGGDGGDHGAGAVLPGHDLSRLARRPARSGRGAAL